MGWNVGERKPHKAVGDCGFSNPEGANSACSAYCLLSAGFAYSTLYIYNLFEYIIIPIINNKIHHNNIFIIFCLCVFDLPNNVKNI